MKTQLCAPTEPLGSQKSAMSSGCRSLCGDNILLRRLIVSMKKHRVSDKERGREDITTNHNQYYYYCDYND